MYVFGGWVKPEVVVVGTLVSSGTLRYVSVLLSGSRLRVQSLVLVFGVEGSEFGTGVWCVGSRVQSLALVFRV